MLANYRRLLRLTLFIALILLCLAGCHKRTTVVALAKPPFAELPPAPDPAPPIAPERFPVINGPVDVTLPPPPPATRRDEELFQLGLNYALSENPNHDWQRATTFFTQLVTEFPDSPFRSAAELVLSLRTEVTQLNSDAEKRDQRIKQLTTELDRLKQIDAERRRRP